MVINFDFLFFFETKNWEIAKNNDNQIKKFPKKVVGQEPQKGKRQNAKQKTNDCEQSLQSEEKTFFFDPKLIRQARSRLLKQPKEKVQHEHSRTER